MYINLIKLKPKLEYFAPCSGHCYKCRSENSAGNHLWPQLRARTGLDLTWFKDFRGRPPYLKQKIEFQGPDRPWSNLTFPCFKNHIPGCFPQYCLKNHIPGCFSQYCHKIKFQGAFLNIELISEKTAAYWIQVMLYKSWFWNIYTAGEILIQGVKY